jgi:hypothetical protein
VAHEAERVLAAGSGEVPDDWEAYRDGATGACYYHNHALQCSAWTHPLQVPLAAARPLAALSPRILCA